MIRIVGGLYRGRKIYVPSGKNVKVTSDQFELNADLVKAYFGEGFKI